MREGVVDGLPAQAACSAPTEASDLPRRITTPTISPQTAQSEKLMATTGAASATPNGEQAEGDAQGDHEAG
jgi:hypothetical protein